MLRALEPGETPPPSSYPIPWRVEHGAPSHPVVVNKSRDPLDFVRVFVDAPRFVPETELWGQMLPGDAVQLCLCDLDPDDAVVTLAWFRADTGEEYIWRFTA